MCIDPESKIYPVDTIGFNPEKPRIVTPSEMKDGEIGEIVEWTFDGAIGRIVQKYKESLISLGMHSGKSFSLAGNIKLKGCEVRILPPGTKFEL